MSWSRLTALRPTGRARPGSTARVIPSPPMRCASMRPSTAAAADAIFQGARRSLDQVLADAARRGGRPAGFALPGSARLERDGADATRFSSPNVVAVLPGSDPALAGEYVLLMAHLDGLGVRTSGAGERRRDRIRNGAMDNASGVATLIEVARAMARSATARAGRSCSPPSPPRKSACSARNFSPATRWAAAASSRWSISTCRS